MRGRRRTPTKVLEMRGAFERNPQRRKEREGEPDLPLGVGDAPDYFDAEQRLRWVDMATEGATWLTRADRFKLEEAAKLGAESRRGKLSTADGKRYDKLLGDLGFDPIARTRVKATSGKEKAKLDKFA